MDEIFEYKVFSCVADDAALIERNLNHYSEMGYVVWRSCIINPPKWTRELSIPSNDAKQKLTFIMRRKSHVNEEAA